MTRFVMVNRDTAYLLPPSVDEFWRATWRKWSMRWISPMVRAYAGRSSDAHHPAVLSALLIYGYATGVYSSRKIEAATMARSPFASSPAILTPITIRRPLFDAALLARSSKCSCRVAADRARELV